MVGRLLSVSLAHDTRITAISVGSDGRVVTGDGRGWIAGWDAFGCAWRLRPHRRGLVAIESHDEATAPVIVSGGFDGTVRRIVRGNEVHIASLVRFRRGVSSVALDPEERRVVATSLRGEVSIRDIDEPRPRLNFRLPVRGPAFARFTPDGRAVVAWGARGHIELRSIATPAERSAWSTGEPFVFDVVPSANGMLVTLGYDHTLRFFMMRPWVELARLELPFHGRCSVVGHAADSIWIRGDQEICEVDISAMDVRSHGRYPGMTAARLNPAGDILAIGYRNGELQTWRVRDTSVTRN